MPGLRAASTVCSITIDCVILSVPLLNDSHHGILHLLLRIDSSLDEKQSQSGSVLVRSKMCSSEQAVGGNSMQASRKPHRSNIKSAVMHLPAVEPSQNREQTTCPRADVKRLVQQADA